MPITGSSTSERGDTRSVLVLSLLAAIVAWLAHELIYPALSWNRDEPVYLWHADALRAGFMTPPDGGHPSSFLPWLSGHNDGSMFTQYTLGWPLLLAASALTTGSTVLVLPLGAALATAGTYLLGVELLEDRKVATIATLLLIASPIFPIQGGVYLSYVFTLGLGLLHIALVLGGLRTGRGGRFVAAGALLGWILLTRPFDAILWGIAAAGCALLVRRRPRGSHVRALTLTAAATAPFVGIALAYNRHVTGRFLELPITQVDPLDTFGFGTRRLMPAFQPVDYDVATAVRATAKNLFVLPWFLTGTYVSIVLAAWVIWRRRRAPSTAALVLAGGAFPLGYFAFWGTYLSSQASRISGPIYFVPLYAPICLLVAIGLVEIWTRARRRAWVLLMLVIVATVPAAVTRIGVNREISEGQRPWADSVAGLDEPALVFVADSGPYLLHLNPFSRNSPTLDDAVLYATAGTPAMLELIADLPTRRPYLQVTSIATEEIGPREKPSDYDVHIVPITVHRAAAVELEIDVAPPPGYVLQRLRLEAGAEQLDVAPGVVRLGPRPGSVDFPIQGAGAVTVTAELGDRRGAAATVTVRASYVFRSVDGGVELLDPPALERWTPVGDRHEWRHELTLPELSVKARPG